MLIRFLLIAFLFYLIARAFWRIVDGVIEGAGGSRRRVRAGTKLVRDPVCGTYVVATPALSLSSGGETHFFCSEACLVKYREDNRERSR